MENGLARYKLRACFGTWEVRPGGRDGCARDSRTTEATSIMIQFRIIRLKEKGEAKQGVDGRKSENKK